MKNILLLVMLFFTPALFAADYTVTFSWDPNPAADQVTTYECQYAIGGGLPVPCSGIILAPNTTHTQTITANPGDIIFAQVKANNAVGSSPYSLGVSGAFPATSNPNAPSGTAITITFP